MSIFATKESFEVIVIDNASDDKSISLLKSTFGHETRLSIIVNSSNYGFARACNIGAELATGKYMLYLNPDCILQPNSISNLLKALNENPLTGMVGGLLINADGSEQGGARRVVPTPWRSFVRAFGLHRFSNRWPKLLPDFSLHKQALPDNPIEVEAISGACMLVRRDAQNEVGPMDEGYFMHCEDLDWCIRFRQKGWKILFVPDARIVHYLGVCSKSRPIFVEWHKHKGMVRFYNKFFRYQYPGVLMWLVSLGVWIRFGLIAIYYSARHIARWLGSKNA